MQFSPAFVCLDLFSFLPFREGEKTRGLSLITFSWQVLQDPLNLAHYMIPISTEKERARSEKTRWAEGKKDKQQMLLRIRWFRNVSSCLQIILHS